MSFLSKFFNRGKPKVTEAPAEAVECPHGVLVPKWDSVQDMGNEEKATSFECEACRRSFSVEETRALRESLAERLRVPESSSEI